MAALLQRLTSAVRARWLYHLGGAPARRMQLGMRRIYIVPSRAGLQCAVLLLVMLLASLNYNLGLGYALTFLLSACVLADMIATARNLAGLQLSTAHAPAVFAGTTARFQIVLATPATTPHYAIWLGFQADGEPMQHCDVLPREGATCWLPAATSQRGWQTAARIRLVTRFPLGLFRAWSYWQPAQQLLVYPAPEVPAPPLPPGGNTAATGTQRGKDEHYAGLRNYQRGDAPRQLAWRQIARHAATSEAPLLSKQLDGSAGHGLLLDLAALPPQLTLEQQLARLCAWVLAAEAQGLSYALQLDDARLGPALGGPHQAACLEALATYRLPAAAAPSEGAAR